MSLYASKWMGLDRGREGFWREPLWSSFIRIAAEHEGEDFYDVTAPVYSDLEAAFPNETWRSEEAGGRFRPFIRDYPNAWTKTATLLPRSESSTISVTPVGRAVVAGEITREEVFVAAMIAHEEAGENPYAIIAAAFLESPSGELTLGDVYCGIMRRFRPGIDSFSNALQAGRRSTEAISANRDRRLRSILELLEHAGAIEPNGQRVWRVHSRGVLQQIATGDVSTTPSETAEEKAARIVTRDADQFDATDEADGRRKALRSMAVRQGQKAFRNRLLHAYGGRCPISGSTMKDLLDACHISKYLGPRTNHVTNGMPLRTDLHGLFDLGLIAIDETRMTVIVAPAAMTEYGQYHGRALMLPADPTKAPDVTALRLHRKRSGL